MEESQDTVVNVAKKERRPVRGRGGMEGEGGGGGGGGGKEWNIRTEERERERDQKYKKREERGIEGKRDDVCSIFERKSTRVKMARYREGG